MAYLPHLPCRSSLPLVSVTAAGTSIMISRSQGSSSGRLIRQRRRGDSGVVLVLSASVKAPPPRTVESSSSGKVEDGNNAIDWLDQWYPFAPVCDLDPSAPHGKMVLDLRVVAWYDRTGAADGEWRVFDDVCPHRLAPLSEGRMDGKGRLQCVYHGWCCDGAGDCKFIPQAPALGPPVHKNSKACVASYPCVVQNQILWFYPRTEPEYRDVVQRKRPPYIPEIDDPSYFTLFGIRDFHYGYDTLVENLMDPAHVPYAHKGMLFTSAHEEDPGRVEFDQEGGDPIKMKIEQASIAGYLSTKEGGSIPFMAPCTIHGSSTKKVAADTKTQPWFMAATFCIPVAPWRSRLIWAFPRNCGVWLYRMMPRWFSHMVTNRLLDSDLYLLHFEERKYAAVGLDNWQNACYVPTSSDNMVTAFRNWFRKYCKNQIGWATPQHNQLPHTPPKDSLLERYLSHVAQCTSCRAALKAMKALEVALQVASVAVVGFLAVAKGTLIMSTVQTTAVVSAAVLCFAASRWHADYIEKNFYFEDYVHAHK